MRSHWVSVGGVILLAAVAVLATVLAGVLVFGDGPARMPTSGRERPPQWEDATIE